MTNPDDMPHHKTNPLKIAQNALGMLPNLLIYLFKRPKIEKPRLVSHTDWPAYLAENFNKPGMRILEIGSRNVTGANFREMFDQADYIGFDYLDGENVDIVGDAHRLDSFFQEGQKFDLIFSSAVFEHLYMPWVVAEKMADLLADEGHIFVETHFSFISHERPWNFFQFSDMGLRALFNDALGLEKLDGGMSNPIVGVYGAKAVPSLRFRPLKELYCHSAILVRKYKPISDFDWRKCEAAQLVGETHYPAPKKAP